MQVNDAIAGDLLAALRSERDFFLGRAWLFCLV